MKNILFLVLVFLTTNIFAQRQVTFTPVEHLEFNKVDTSSVTITEITMIELDDSTEVIVTYNDSTCAHYHLPIYFGSAVGLYYNAQYVLYKDGYISRRQFCECRRKCEKVWIY
jgi:hypothetical protein